MSELENRVMELEIKNAHQELTIEQLNQIIITQQETLTQLNQRFDLLTKKVESLQERNNTEQPEPPPPHY